MYVSTRDSRPLDQLHVFELNGTPLGNVACFKYVGVWFDNKGTCEVQANQLIKKATSSMYMCMSKSRQISFRCPPALRVMVFKSHVMSVLRYGCEVTPYSSKNIKSMNKLIVKYARWATGLPAQTCTNAVLREASLRPMQYEFLQARIVCFSVFICDFARATSYAPCSQVRH